MKIHIVQKGDTLWKISKKYGVDFEELKAVNTQLSNPDNIMPGMKIKVPTGTVHVKKEAQIGGVQKEAQINLAAQKEEQITHPYADITPEPFPVLDMEEEEIPVEEEVAGVETGPYIPQMPQMPQMPMPQMPQYQPFEIDINNFNLMNMPMPQVPTPPPNVLPGMMAPEEDDEVLGVEDELDDVPQMPQMPTQQQMPMGYPAQAGMFNPCVPVTPVMPGTGLHGPQWGPPAQGPGGFGPMRGFPAQGPGGFGPMQGFPAQGPSGFGPMQGLPAQGPGGFGPMQGFPAQGPGQFGPMQGFSRVEGVEDVELPPAPPQMAPMPMMPQYQPFEIDINNFNIMNTSMPQMPPAPDMVAGVEDVADEEPQMAPMPQMQMPPLGNCVPISPVLPGSGLGGFPGPTPYGPGMPMTGPMQGNPQAVSPFGGFPGGAPVSPAQAYNKKDCGCGGPKPHFGGHYQPQGYPVGPQGFPGQPGFPGGFQGQPPFGGGFPGQQPYGVNPYQQTYNPMFTMPEFDEDDLED